MPEVLFSVDQSRSFYDLPVPPHNRWHPDVPPVATVRPGTEFRLECREWNSCATLYLPTAIFDFDIRPSAEGPQRADRGSCASAG